jgi:hypothetical protein
MGPQGAIRIDYARPDGTLMFRFCWNPGALEPRWTHVSPEDEVVGPWVATFYTMPRGPFIEGGAPFLEREGTDHWRPIRQRSIQGEDRGAWVYFNLDDDPAHRRAVVL